METSNVLFVIKFLHEAQWTYFTVEVSDDPSLFPHVEWKNELWSQVVLSNMQKLHDCCQVSKMA